MLKQKVLVMLTALLILAVPVSAQEEVVDLEEVVVTASRYEESIMDTPVSIEVIDQEEIEGSNAKNLADLLKSTSSIHIKDNGGSYAKKDILIRGFRGDQVLILLDGHPYNNPNDGEVKLQQIPIHLIKKIEILKSSSSAVYGANAMGGVINIITKDGEDIEKTNFSVGLGSFDTRKMNFSSGFNTEKANFLISYDDLYSDGHRDQETSETDREDVFLKYKYSLSNNSDLSLSFKYNDSYIEFPGNTLSKSNGVMDDIDRNINLILNQSYQNKDRKISFNMNNKDFHAITYDYNDYETDTEVKSYGLSYQESRYFDQHTLGYGIDIINNEVKSEINRYDYNLFSYVKDTYDKENMNKALFIQDKYEINSKNILDFGIRYDDHEEFGSELSPKLGYIYKIKDNFNFNFSAAQSYRAPSFYELYGTYGNSDLDTEKSNSYDMGFKYETEKGYSEITLFKRDVEDLIVTDYTKSININEDEADISGMEYSLNHELTKQFEFDFNYTYLDAKNSNDKQLIDMPYHKLNLDVHYKMDKTKISMLNRFVGERNDVQNTPPYKVVKSSSYFVSDLRISNNLTKNIRLSLEINNLFDKEYEVINDYPMPGRNFMVNLSTKF
ncbi:TonB-dependent receptor plug domain-containing protein [Halanaerobium congolense]|uniref:TonB-dependent receptor plug domain-containing protein n=1 Tax=Halanaerobium congolense TaxID=54121 RepID=UPI0008897258|nr:TonB-dependent receptor [Halanaerobium congolense]SDG81213.1 outer membrane receptor for ferrienterochelin and colicins [Halanaerobium congolense]SHM20714.1 outer membrane receptor for ferrienterochelin and colicins [Halanaerobium congolense]